MESWFMTQPATVWSPSLHKSQAASLTAPLQPVPAPAGATAGATGRLHLARYTEPVAHEVASWVRTTRELTFLAPGTPGPLTPEKVAAWGRQPESRLLLVEHGCLAYGELNRMSGRPDQMWIGHLIVNPAFRGRGVGRRFTQALLARAFQECGAAEVLLLVFPQNRAAVRCYERCGMVVAGQEHKSFPVTRSRHLFLRMSIHVSRFERLVREGRMPAHPLPLRDSVLAAEQVVR
jgi:GNAT superfamily N-acetyltransferase